MPSIHIICIALHLNTKFSKISKFYLYVVKTHFLGSIWTKNIFENLGSNLNSK
jgi:hypothetical protein